ncbi:DUF5906 domain-containing protein [Mesorhizobium sp. M1A.F.Ca.IN.020.03.2.1]|uniref:DUF5906 domain-containing protein n=1 Tax=Mesorhizobium sp. M1A.F.Ca.IN.020.03.2.1 TaxID=2496769 RepID=UPI001FDEF49A|nr:DUF5906 domain-containing protein [Mesorhizobium sp. M1A.F.Ca.IN.020.03.2.1]
MDKDLGYMSQSSVDLDESERFAERFRGYTAAYGRYVIQRVNEKGKSDGKGTTIEEPVTQALFDDHLAGISSLGILPLDADNKVSWACIDIDEIGIDHKELIRKIDELRLPLLVCRSKSGGAHCFLFLVQPSDADVVRRYLVACAAALGHPGTEVFPKQTQRKEGEVGNWLNLPYFFESKTTRFAVADDGDALPLVEFLNKADATAVAVESLVAPHVSAELVPLKRGEKFVLPDMIPEGGTIYGGRDNTLFKYGCSLRAKGADDEKVTLELRMVNAERCDPPLPRSDVERITKQVLKHEQGHPIPEWVEEMNERHAVVAEAGKAFVLNLRDWDPAMKRRVLTYSSFTDFKNLYCNAYVQLGEKYAAKGAAWLAHPQRRQFNGTTFAPGDETPGWFNTWQGYSVEPIQGDWSLLKRHIFENLCGSSHLFLNYLLGWMAFAVQRPQQVPEVAVVLMGGRGTGKGIVVNAHGSLMREHYVSVSNPEHVSGKFNAHLKDTVILFLDEAFWAGDKKGEGTLKRLITDEFIPVEKKRIDVVMSRNYCHVWVASNERWAVPSGLDERRFFVLDVSKAKQQDHEYFGAIAKQLDDGGRSAMLYDLLHLDLSNFNPRQAPMTPALFRQKIHSMDKKTAWWFECLWNGEITLKRGDDTDEEGASGWKREVVKDKVYQAYLEHSGNAGARAHRGTQTELGMFLSSMLPDGWPKDKRVGTTKWAEDNDGQRRPIPTTAPGYELPRLEECREWFDRESKQTTDWPEIYGVEDEDIPF